MVKIALVSNTDFSLYNFRMGLIRALIARGYDVSVICPHGEYVGELVKSGVQHYPLDIDRKGMKVYKVVKYLDSYEDVYLSVYIGG